MAFRKWLVLLAPGKKIIKKFVFFVHEGEKIFLCWTKNENYDRRGRIMGSFKKLVKNSKKEKFLIVSKELLPQPPHLTKGLLSKFFKMVTKHKTRYAKSGKIAQ